MHILDVEIADQTSVNETGIHRATLLLTTQDGCVSLRAMTELQGFPSAEKVKHRLMADALRQIKRMPEYRTGVKTVTVAKDALEGLPELA